MLKNAIFMNIEKPLDELGVTLSKPRTTGIMRHRPNPSCESLEQYYRQIIYVPLLDSIITDLESRFSAEITSLFNLNIIKPMVKGSLFRISDQKPTFVTSNRREVLDLAVSTRYVSNKITNWREIPNVQTGKDSGQHSETDWETIFVE
ncbi:hypothetical protein JTB14_023860 [Gonioctena quinquepunctata]|nr:hypothetical protein JTB14_023860 [Gonioctena quinquepunctata]